MRFSQLVGGIVLIALFTGTFALAQDQAKPLYLDPNQPVDVRVHDLISRLTLEEKAALLDHEGPEVKRFHILSDKWNQCLHGVVWDRPTTMYPDSIALAATWDTPLVHHVADQISDEARAIYNLWHQQPDIRAQHKGLIYRAPVINVARNPYWGRINECYGEDPFLTGRMGVAFVTGLQGDDPRYLKLVSTLKHFAVNNVEKDRQKLSATVPERMLHEYWLPHFRDCIVEGHAQSVMASYNAINGTPNNMNSLLLTDILRKQWGFDGFVVSDLGGVNTMVRGHEQGRMSVEEAVAKSINAGCDFSDREFRTEVPNAVRNGLLSEARLDEAVYRVMRDRFRLGEFDPPEMVPFSKLSPDVIASAEHRATALKAAQEAIVLLKNDGNLLPLDKSKIKTIAMIGPHADLFTAGGYSGRAKDPVTPMKGIENRAAPGTKILYAAGAEIVAPRRGPDRFDRQAELKKSVDIAKQADVAIVCVGTTLDVEAEGRDRTSLGLPGNQKELIDAVLAANPRTIVVELNAGPLAIPDIAQRVPAMIESWWNGEEGGNALADVIFGNVNPSGKMPLTVYASADQVPPQDEYDVTKGFTYMYLNGRPLFAFGHGLSYTTFEYGPLKLARELLTDKDTVSATVTVKNTGARAGDEVVQFYIHQQVSSVKRPIVQLRGFRRVSLEPGASQSVTFEIPASQFAFYDVAQHRFRVEAGEFDIMVGSASDDIRGKAQVEIAEKN